MTTTARNATAEASATMVRAATTRVGMHRAAATLAATTALSDRPSHHALEEAVLPEADLKVAVLLVIAQPADDQQLVVQHRVSQLATDLRMENLRVTDRHTASRLEIAVLVLTVPKVERARNAADAAIVPAHPELVEHLARELLETVAHLAAALRVRAARIPGANASLS